MLKIHYWIEPINFLILCDNRYGWFEIKIDKKCVWIICRTLSRLFSCLLSDWLSFWMSKAGVAMSYYFVDPLWKTSLDPCWFDSVHFMLFFAGFNVDCCWWNRWVSSGSVLPIYLWEWQFSPLQVYWFTALHSVERWLGLFLMKRLCNCCYNEWYGYHLLVLADYVLQIAFFHHVSWAHLMFEIWLHFYHPKMIGS